MITMAAAKMSSALDHAGDVLDLLVPVAMRGVGRLGAPRAPSTRAMIEAMRSEPECSASEMMPIDPEMSPTVSLKTISVEFETIETPGGARLERVLWTSAGATRLDAHGGTASWRGARATPAPRARGGSGRSCRPRPSRPRRGSSRSARTAGRSRSRRRRAAPRRSSPGHSPRTPRAPVAPSSTQAITQTKRGRAVVLARQGDELGEQPRVVGHVVALATGIARRDHARAPRPAPPPRCPSRRR